MSHTKSWVGISSHTPYKITKNYKSKHYYKEKVGRKTKSRERNQKVKSSWNSGRLAGKHPFSQRRKFRNVEKFIMFAKLATKLRNYHSSFVLHCTSSAHPIFALMLSFQLEFFMNELDS